EPAGSTSPAPRAPATGPGRPTATAGCASRSWSATPTGARPPPHRRRPAWPTRRPATRRAAGLRAELVGLLPGAAVVELERRLGRRSGRPDGVHPARLAPCRRVG